MGIEFFQVFSVFIEIMSFLIYFDSMVFADAAAKLRQSCLTLCDPIDGSRPGSSVPGILQARILEWSLH